MTSASLLSALLRIVALAASALACAALAGFAALCTHTLLLPPSDGAYGLPIWELFSDPFVALIWRGYVLIGAVVGFPISVWTLWRVQLRKAVPVVTGTTVLVAAVTGPLVPFGMFAAFIAGVAAMRRCRGRADWRLDAEPGEGTVASGA